MFVASVRQKVCRKHNGDFFRWESSNGFGQLARGVVEAKCLDQAMKELCSLSKPQGRRFVAILQYGYKIQLLPMARVYIYIYICVNYNISLTWIKPIWGWFPGREWQGYVYLHDKCGKSNNRDFTCFSPMNSYTRDLALSNRGHHKWPNSLRLHNDKGVLTNDNDLQGPTQSP